MKYALPSIHCIVAFIIVLVSVCSVKAQNDTLSDDFSDGNFTADPAWIGATKDFEVVSDSGNNRLHLNATGSGRSYLALASATAYGSWKFSIRLDFAPSGSNRALIFLTSDHIYGDSLSSGYAIIMGESGSDDVVHLARYASGTPVSTILSGTTNIASGGIYTIKVTRSIDGEWKLYVGKGFASTPLFEASGSDQTNQTSSYFVFNPHFTSTRSDKFFLDDIFITGLKIKPVSVEAKSNSLFNVVFSRPVATSALNSSDFFIQGKGPPDRVKTLNDKTVQIHYSSPLTGGKYGLTVRNILSSDGNTMSTDTTLYFTVFDSPVYNDIVINEFMYNPPYPLPEYVELYNRSDKIINLENWQLDDRTNTVRPITPDTLAILPHHYIVATPDTASLYHEFGSHAYLDMPSFPILNNSGDAIRLIDDNGILIDSVTYTGGTNTSGKSLERRSPYVASGYPLNWGASPAPNGGTPGTANQLTADRLYPILQSITVENAQRLRMIFSEKLDSVTVMNSDNFSFSPSLSISGIKTLSGDTVSLQLNTPLIPNKLYKLHIGAVGDLFGNPITNPDTSFTFYQIQKADSGNVLLSEFMPNPPDEYSEYIELYNKGSKAADLNGWSLSDNTGNRQEIANGKSLLPPHEYLVLCPDSTLTKHFPDIHTLVIGRRFPTLNNSGDAIVIYGPKGRLLDSLTYDESWEKGEKALERRSMTVSALIKENWGVPPDRTVGSPGEPNSVKADTLPPRLASLIIIDNRHLSLSFSEPVTSSSAKDITNYQCDPPVNITGVTARKNTYTLQLSDKLSNETEYKLSVKGVTDIFGNKMSGSDTTFTYLKATKVDSGDVLLSEFMPNPPDGYSEYIELCNKSSKTVDLHGWTLSDNTGTKHVIASKKHCILPHSYFILCPDSTLVHSFPAIHALVIGRHFPTLNNNGDAIAIYGASGRLLDSLAYDISWEDGEKAIERKSFSVSALYPENWKVSTAAGAGTPGRPNKVKADRTPPVVQKVTIIKPDRIRVVLSKRVAISKEKSTVHFVLSPAISIKKIKEGVKRLDLLLKRALTGYTHYKLTTRGIPDIFGNKSITKSFKLFYTPDITPPKLISARFNRTQSEIRLQFTEPVMTTPETRMELDGLDIRIPSVPPDDSTLIRLPMSGLPDSKKDDIIQIRQISDESGNRLTDTAAVISRLPVNGMIAINEIMYNPIRDKNDGRPDQSEYVECFNRTPFTLNLNGISLHTSPDENNKVRYITPVTLRYCVLKPHRYFVIYADTNTRFINTRIARYFNPETDSSAFLRVNRLTLGLSSVHGTVYISNAIHQDIDTAIYDNSWQNPNLPDTRGISLERIDAAMPGRSRNNWGSSASPSGGTPGEKNSIAVNPLTNIKKEGIVLTPNPFSPDHDGYDDHLLIHYHLKDPDYLLHIRIFDRFGRLIRTLADGKRAGTDGTIIWNGLNDQNRPDRIGIYIILFEAYDPSRGSKKVFKKPFVLARML